LLRYIKGLPQRGYRTISVIHRYAQDHLIDSFPIRLAKNNYAYTAKVAPKLANKSDNSTKKMYYYGGKSHVVARKREANLPEFIEEAKRQDRPVFDSIRSMLTDNLLFAWLNKVTGIEDTLSVRSSKGLLTHIYGRLAVAMMLRSYLELGF